MGLSETFDKVLLRGDKNEIFAWAIDRLAWHAESPEANGIASFAFYVAGNRWIAREIAEETLREDPVQEWALAVVLGDASLKNVEKRGELFVDGGFCLGPEWIARFFALGCEMESRKVAYCLARFGSPAQRAELSENWLPDTCGNKSPDGARGSLPENQRGGEKPLRLIKVAQTTTKRRKVRSKKVE